MIQLPNEVAVRELLTMMVGSDVAVRYASQPALTDGTIGAVARYVDDEGVLRALGACDLLVANALGHALALLPQQRVTEAVEAGHVPDNAQENLHEVFNVGANLLNAPERPHLRLDQVLTGAGIPAEMLLAVTSAVERLDLDIEITGHGAGPFAMVLPTSAPGTLEETPGPDDNADVQPEPTQQAADPAQPSPGPTQQAPRQASGSAAARPPTALSSFDFEAPLPLPATAPRLVSRVQDVSPRIGVALSVACGRTVVVTCTGAERVSSGHLAQAGITWSWVDCAAFGKAILAVPPTLTVALADTLMGGSGRTAVTVTDRAATTLEQRLVLRHLGPALQPLVLAFAGNGLSALVVGELETHSLPASIGDLVTLRLLTTIEGVGVSDTVTLALPAAALLPGAELRLVEPSAATAAALAEVPVELSLRLAATAMSAADVESLQAGDVVRLDHPVGQPLVGLLDDNVVLHATLGRRGRRRAVQVTDLLGGS